MTCECDYDCVGDPPRFVKCSRNVCPVHDPCESCMEGHASNRENGEWLCEECAKEDE